MFWHFFHTTQDNEFLYFDSYLWWVCKVCVTHHLGLTETLLTSYPPFSYLGALSDIQLVQFGSGTVSPGGALSLTCTVSEFSVLCPYLHWVQKHFWKGLAWKGAVNWTRSRWHTNYASFLQVQITISADTPTNSFSLQPKSLTAADTETYFR